MTDEKKNAECLTKAGEEVCEHYGYSPDDLENSWYYLIFHAIFQDHNK